MAIFYNEGETKTRPGVYQRYTNVGLQAVPSAQDGICAIPVHAAWGPLGVVLKNTSIAQLEKNYGSGDYSATHTVPAAAEMLRGGASAVYTYRLGTGGTAASKTLGTGSTLKVTAKYPGAVDMSISVQTKIGDDDVKVLTVYFGTEQVERFEFEADTTAEGANLIAATAGSAYIIVSDTGTTAVVPITAASAGTLTGGANPTVNNASYSAAFSALEATFYNVIALDVDDDENMTLSILLQEYLDSAFRLGKLAIAVVGEKTTVAFSTRLSHATTFNDAKVVYLGGGWKSGDESKDGVLAICFTAGMIAATPANRGITHATIRGATDPCEYLTFSQFEDAIRAGALMVSQSPEGLIWYDSAVNTLVSPDVGTQDDGWKKIRRVKVRFELFDRLDRALSVKVGRVSADNDGIADVIQTGQRVVDAMSGEGKLFTGGTFTADPERPYEGDSAWFIIAVDDIDSLEKIYLKYQFRYSQNA